MASGSGIYIHVFFGVTNYNKKKERTAKNPEVRDSDIHLKVLLDKEPKSSRGPQQRS